MTLRTLCSATFVMLAAIPLVSQGFARKPIFGTGQTGNDAIDITATALVDKEEIRQAIGADLPGTIIVVEIRVAPKDDKKLRVSLDDFTLLAHNDGQKSQPFTPSQIAGKGALMVTPTGNRGSMMGQGNGPIWGGIPGTGGRPRRLPGDGGGIGNGSTEQGGVKATVQTNETGKENPILTTLKEKVLPEKETSEPLSGLLYFPMEGKHKIKDLILMYRGPAGRLELEFKK